MDLVSWDRYLPWAEKEVPIGWDSHLSRDDDVESHLKEESQNAHECRLVTVPEGYP